MLFQRISPELAVSVTTVLLDSFERKRVVLPVTLITVFSRYYPCRCAVVSCKEMQWEHCKLRIFAQTLLYINNHNLFGDVQFSQKNMNGSPYIFSLLSCAALKIWMM